MGTSRPLNTLSADDMKHSIKLYKLDLKNNGNAFVMKAYANMVNDGDLEAIYNYLKSIQGK